MQRVAIGLGAAAILAFPALAQGPKVTPKPATHATRATTRCAPTAGIADYRGEKAVPRKLGEMPAATQIYTVYNVVDGCPTPIVLRKGVGAHPQDTAPIARTPPRPIRAR